MNCPHCGTPLPNKVTICYRCGMPFSTNPGSPATGSRVQYIQDPSPLTPKEFALMIFLANIPLVGLILLLVWAFGDTNSINKQNFAKGYLYLLCVLVGIYLVIMLFGLLLSLFRFL